MKMANPLIMGILNVTPDSFSDGGQYYKPDQAIKHAMTMLEEGADIIDIGGESTRPGAESVDEAEQIRRVIPVIAQLKTSIPQEIIISIDTTSSNVAKAAIEAGANWINDVSGGEDSRDMLQLAADSNATIVLMHRQGISATMQNNPHYDDVTKEVTSYLQARAETAMQAGIHKDHIILDPGIGFGKTFQHNLQLMNNLKAFTVLGYRTLLGTSRKRFLSEICKLPGSPKLAAATAATTTLGVMAGIEVFRVHDVMENRHAADISWKIINQDNKSYSD